MCFGACTCLVTPESARPLCVQLFADIHAPFVVVLVVWLSIAAGRISAATMSALAVRVAQYLPAHSNAFIDVSANEMTAYGLSSSIKEFAPALLRVKRLLSSQRAPRTLNLAYERILFKVLLKIKERFPTSSWSVRIYTALPTPIPDTLITSLQSHFFTSKRLAMC